MKNMILIFAMILALAVTALGQAPAPPTKSHGNEGDKGAVTTFSGLSNLAINNFHQGFGFRYYLANCLSVRATVGGKFTSGGEQSYKETALSGALLFDLFGGARTNLYIGPEIFYSHSDPNSDRYVYGGVVGVEVFGVFTPGLSLGTEFPVGVMTDKAAGTTTWTFGQTGGELILSWWF